VYVLKTTNPHKVRKWVEPLLGQPRAVSGAGGATDGGARRRMAPDATGAGDDRGPSLIQAAREQAGPILEPARRTVSVLVIDRIERSPTDN
jgi:uncharacterized protein (TIGR03435 family)